MTKKVNLHRMVRATLFIIIITSILLVALIKLNQQPFGHINSSSPINTGHIEPQLLIEQDRAILLSPDGHVWIWGGGGKDTTFETWTGYRLGSEIPIPIQSESNFIKIVSTYGMIFALDEEGFIWRLGSRSPILMPMTSNSNSKVFQKQFNDGGFIDISAGMEHVVALKMDGTLWTWGNNKWDQLGQGLLRDQGLAYPLKSTSLLRIGLDSDWEQVETAVSETYGMKTDGSLWRWGNEPYSNPAPGNLYEKPVQITDKTGWVQIATGQIMAIFLHEDGSIWGTGRNLKNGFMEDYQPTGPGTFGRLGSDNNWIQIVMGNRNPATIFAQKKDKSWWTSGYNRMNKLALDPSIKIKTSYKLYVPRLTKLPDTFSPWAMAIGLENTLVMTLDGQLWNSGRILGRARPVSKWNTFAEAINRFNNFAPSLHLPVRLPDHHSGFHRIWGWPPKPEESFYVQEEDPELP